MKKLLDHPLVRYLLRLNSNIQEDFIGLVAGGVAFYFFLAAFPAIALLAPERLSFDSALPEHILQL